MISWLFVDFWVDSEQRTEKVVSLFIDKLKVRVRYASGKRGNKGIAADKRSRLLCVSSSTGHHVVCGIFFFFQYLDGYTTSDVCLYMRVKKVK